MQSPVLSRYSIIQFSFFVPSLDAFKWEFECRQQYEVISLRDLRTNFFSTQEKFFTILKISAFWFVHQCM